MTINCDGGKITLHKTDLIGRPTGNWIWQVGNDNNQIAFFVTTERHLYRSFDGGKTYVDQNPLLQGINDKGLYGLSGVNTITDIAGIGIVITSFSPSIWITADQGKTYTRYSTPNYIYEFIYPHPNLSKYILAQAGTMHCYNFTEPGVCRYDLLISKDTGKTWSLVEKYVWTATWGFDSISNGTDIWYISQKNSGNQNFYESYDLYTSILGENKKLMYEVCRGFLARNGYYFVAVDSKISANSLELHASKDGKSFFKIIFPAKDVLTEQKYSILDTQSGSTFINVDHSTTNDGWGNLYVAGAFEKNFDVSLLFNVRNGGRVDFSKISSVEGVYLANQLEILSISKSHSSPSSPSSPSFSRSESSAKKEETLKEKLKKQKEKEQKTREPNKLGHPSLLYSSLSPLSFFPSPSSLFQDVENINVERRDEEKNREENVNKENVNKENVNMENVNKENVNKENRDVEKRKEANKKTKITYDNGGNWEEIEVEKGYCNGNVNEEGKCTLNLAGKAEVTFPNIFSLPQATGIIIGSGNVGDSLPSSLDLLSVWLSRDAGMTWQKIQNTSQTFAIADRGAIMTFASANTLTSSFSYTLDEGLTFSTCDFSSIGSLAVNQIFTNPNEGAQEVILYGRANSIGGSIIHADFTNIHERQCVGADSPDSSSSDFETWFPGKSGCILGQKIQYIRRKRDSKCFIGKGIQTSTVISSCACTREDYECAACFEEDGEGNCVASNSDDPSCPLPPDLSTCTSSDSYYYQTRGYQLVDEDKCTSNSSDIWAPEKIKCGSKTTTGSTTGESKEHVGTFFAVFFVLLLVGAAITFLILIFVARKDHEGKAYKFVSRFVPQSWLNPSDSGYGSLINNDNDHHFDDPLEDEESHQPNVLNDKDIADIFDNHNKSNNDHTDDFDDFNPRKN